MPEKQKTTRNLRAILSADVKGYNQSSSNKITDTELEWL